MVDGKDAMLAKGFQDAKAVRYPCFVQPKLDGIRMLVSLPGLALTSRNGTDFGHLKHRFSSQLSAIAAQLASSGAVALDGELYVHGVPFQRLASMVRNKADPTSGAALEYHVYDVVDKGAAGFKERHAELAAAFARSRVRTHVLLVETRVASSAADVAAELASAEGRGYEGVMVRSTDGQYARGKRSSDLLKYKRFETGEFEIVGFKEASGKDKGTPVFCLRASGSTFFARPTGTSESRRAMFARAPSMVGKMMTVQYQGLSRDGIPRFPVALDVRDYE